MSKLVKEFYNENYKRFSQTRYSVWDVIKKFNKEIKPKSYILEAGCGNGKNMTFLQDNGHTLKGIDFSNNLLDVCKSKNLDVEYADIRNLPFNDKTFDYTISIAVIHHLETLSEIVNSINELLRVTKDNGSILITVWAVEQDCNSRRILTDGPNLVPFEDTFRFYYVFSESSFKELLTAFNVQTIFWEKSNWNAIIKK